MKGARHIAAPLLPVVGLYVARLLVFLVDSGWGSAVRMKSAGIAITVLAALPVAWRSEWAGIWSTLLLPVATFSWIKVRLAEGIPRLRTGYSYVLIVVGIDTALLSIHPLILLTGGAHVALSERVWLLTLDVMNAFGLMLLAVGIAANLLSTGVARAIVRGRAGED